MAELIEKAVETFIGFLPSLTQKASVGGQAAARRWELGSPSADNLHRAEGTVRFAEKPGNSVFLRGGCAKMHNMDWNDLRYFLSVYRAGSANGAARELGVEHTTVGRRLFALETALGATLFIRTPGGLNPTGAATAILPFAEAVERSIGAIRRQIGASDDKVAGTVRLTTSEAFGSYLIRQLPKLHDRYPELKIEIHTGNAVLDLTRGDVDVAVRFAATPQPDLICKCVGHMAWTLYASSAYLSRNAPPVSPDDLTGHELIWFDESLKNSPGARWIREHAKPAKVALVATSLVAAVNAAAAGIGLAMVPCFLAANEPVLRRLTDEPLDMHEIWLVFHPDVSRLARVRAVIDFVAETISADEAFFRGLASRSAMIAN